APASPASASPPARKGHAPATPQLPAAVLLATSGGLASAGALDSVIQGEIDELHVVNVVARPGMDLSAVLLALDCVSETAQCLRAVTTQHSTQVLIAPSLARTSGELVLSLLRFDARDGKMRRATRRQSGQTLSSTTLDAVPDMLRELFELPPKPKPEPAADASLAPNDGKSSPPSAAEVPLIDPLAGTERLPEGPMEPPSAHRRFPLGPVLLGAGGVLLLGGGIIAGVVSQSAQSDYDSLVAGEPPRGNVDEAFDKASTGKTAATTANVLFGLGGAVLVASGIWLTVELTRKPADTYEHVQLTPMIGPNQLGLVLTQRGAGL
ncbi:MAG: hypothetical protein ABW321_01805, partial [Polyangiales bacterium]